MSLRRLYPRVPHSLPIESFHPYLFTRPDQHSSLAASDLVSFGRSNNGEMDDSLSLAASDAEELSGSTPCILHSPAHPAESRNHPVAAWMNGSCRGAARPLINELCHSSKRSTTTSPNLGIHVHFLIWEIIFFAISFLSLFHH